MSYWENQKARMKSGGANIRDEQISFAKNAILQTFFDSPSYYRVDSYTSSTPLSSTPLDCWIVDDSKVRDQKKIIAHPNQDLNLGDLIKWRNEYWLATLVDNNLGDIYDRGTIEKCNAILKFLIGEIETITGYDALGRPIKSSTPLFGNYYSVAKSKTRVTTEVDMPINIPDGRVIFSIQYNPNLNIDINKDFEVYGQIWKIIEVDMTKVVSGHGVFSFTGERRGG